MPPKPLEYIFPGIIAAQAIHAAVEFRIPDLLAAGAKSAEELAPACGAHAPTLERLLRALTSIDMFRRTPDGRYCNSPFAEILRRDHPQTLWAEAMFLPAPYVWKAMGELSESVRTGEPAFDRAFGQNFYAYICARPNESVVFNRLMTQEVLWTTRALLTTYDLSRFNRLVDVGGGQGLFLSYILSAMPKLEGVLFDLPEVVTDAKAFFKGDVATRVRIEGGSFFERVPEGGDVYVLRKVIPNWDDVQAAKILGNVRRAMGPDGTLLLIEDLIDSPLQPAGLIDLIMLIVFGGRARTEADLRALVKAAGFSLRRVIPAGKYLWIECCPAQRFIPQANNV
jgi:SAM-dependent methyltransferase